MQTETWKWFITNFKIESEIKNIQYIWYISYIMCILLDKSVHSVTTAGRHDAKHAWLCYDKSVGQRERWQGNIDSMNPVYLVYCDAGQAATLVQQWNCIYSVLCLQWSAAGQCRITDIRPTLGQLLWPESCCIIVMWWATRWVRITFERDSNHWTGNPSNWEKDWHC